MVRWRLCLALAIMLLLPLMISGKNNDDDEEEDRRSEDADEEEDEDDEEEEDGGEEKNGNLPGGGGEVERQERPEVMSGRRAPMVMATPKLVVMSDPRMPKKRPLECFVCAYKSETPLRACLNPTKFRVHTITCHSVDDRCFTSVIPKGDAYEAVVRGCRSGCVGSAETTCCDINRCNNQAFALPTIQARTVLKNSKNKTGKSFPPSIMFFITLLLMLQTVGRVAFI